LLIPQFQFIPVAAYVFDHFRAYIYEYYYNFSFYLYREFCALNADLNFHQMSKDSVSVQKLFDQLNINSTRGIFVIFSVISLIALLLLYLIVDHGRRRNNEDLLALSDLNTALAAQKSAVAEEALATLNYSLLYHHAGRETDRFQTIYSLKNTKNLYDQYLNSASNLDEEGSLEDEFVALRSLLQSYDLQIAASINLDGKVPGLIAQNRQPEDSLSEYLFEVEAVQLPEEQAKDLSVLLVGIQNHLFDIDNQISMLADKKVKAIRSDTYSASFVALAVVFTALLVVCFSMILRRLRRAVWSLSQVLHDIAKGELPDVEVKSEREFQPIIHASHELKAYIDHANQFARHIGEGDFAFDFSPKSKKDALGNSLIEMRNRLQEVTREDKIRNWMNEGQAKFGEILRQYNNDLEKLATKLISNVVDYLNASQGALFIYKEADEHRYLELLASYAFNRKKYIAKKLEIGEGLAGQAFREGKTIYLKDISTDHYNIVTGLGESTPSSLLIVPLKDEDKIEGIIEIASLKEIKPHEIEFIESIGESIASSLNSGKTNETTRKLLDETQEKAEQMKAQEEELRQNMEELAATQEQVQRRNKELEDVQFRFDQERYLLNALLNSTNDRIYFKDRDSKFIKVSKSMLNLFNKENEAEILGKSDFDFGFEAHAKVAFDDEQRIIHTGRPLEDVVEKEQWDDGRITWVSTTKNPLFDLDGKTVGTFGISRDVTKSKFTELEMQKRKDWLEHFFKFQTIGFVVMDQYGKIGYATPGILSQVGKPEGSDLVFEDLFADHRFSDFLVDMKYETVKDTKIDIELKLANESKTQGRFMAVAGSKENEDGTHNIFVIQK
jgi:PAS domain S-box-containing protein